ncbi:MAG: hypothetical protein Q9N32_00875 [Gammaproteobacteria bacterium]|nr:hypothetical protein [Gammaproteobacteria bacterium]
MQKYIMTHWSSQIGGVQGCFMTILTGLKLHGHRPPRSGDVQGCTSVIKLHQLSIRRVYAIII